jgi:hypothetical protein
MTLAILLAITLTGRVIDAKTGEPIRKALVSIREQKTEAVTDDGGRFTLAGLQPGRVELYVSTVGYGLLKREVDLAETAEPLELKLGQEAIQRSEDVTVAASPFDRSQAGAASEQGLDNSELKNLAGVVADDALRSVQTLPGVTTGDDFNAVFSVRGSGFREMAFYIDGVFTTAPFHTIRDINDGFSLTILNGDIVDSVALLSSAAPAPYGARTGAVLNVRTREASRERRVTRASLGATGLSLSSEGPLGSRASWLVAGRKSYLDYIVHRIEEEPSFVLGWYDLQTKLAFETAAHRFTLMGIYGDAAFEQNEEQPSRNSLFTADAGTQIVTGEWRWLASARAVLKTRAYFDRETGERRNRLGEPLGHTRARHAGYRSDLSVGLGASHHLEAGIFARRLHEAGLEQQFDNRTQRFEASHEYDRTTWQPSAYVQDTWTIGPRVTLTLGGRLDRLALTRENVWQPRAALAVELSDRTKVDAAWGRFGQLPGLDDLFGESGHPDLAAARAAHYVAGIEHLLGSKVRLRVEAYYEDKDRFWLAPGSEFRIVGGRVVRPSSFRLQNVLDGSSRGVEILLQRRSANRLSGWVSYSWGHTRFTDRAQQIEFDGDFDQRHTVNVYGSYRVTNTWNLSTKYRYGSNTPIVGFYERRGADFFLAEGRNEVRAPAYSRLDLRANKAFFFRRWKMTLYGEVSNLLNRTHYRYTDLDGVNLQTGQAFLESDTLFPIIPAIGVSVEF